MKALISVYDKHGLIDFARGLVDLDVELIASGGTGKTLRDAGISVVTVEELTGLPGILGGRVKTLHPAIHAGILAQRTSEDQSTIAERGWHFIDLVIVNLYPFVETISKDKVTLEQAIDQIDIGGVALIRAAAKNFKRATIIIDPSDYDLVLGELKQGGVTEETRHSLAVKAFTATAAYDQAITDYLAEQDDEPLPLTLKTTLPRLHTLRYGENPHQKAALYAHSGIGPLGGSLLQGKPLSYNNLLDIDAAWAAAEDFTPPTVVIVKHLSPCGIASGDNLAATFKVALASDPVSAFGGVIACNHTFTADIANAIGDLFVEAIAAPAFSDEARQILSERTNCRLLEMKPLNPPDLWLRSVRGGLLAQTPDQSKVAKWKIVTKRQPTDTEMEALQFAWQAVKHVKSNAIVLAKEQATVGIGGGLPSRVDAVRLAIVKAGNSAQNSVMASDAFFPFPDGPQVAAEAGVTAVVQPGGSVRDEAVIEAVDQLGLAMCFTGVRHFRH